MGVGFLSPLFLLGALAVAVPIVLHLFRRRTDPVVPFSATRFLRKVPVEQAHRRRLQDLLLLALRAAALLLLALGFARPYLRTAASAAEAGLTVVALDVSASLGDAPRFARARSAAATAVNDASSGDDVALLQFGTRADVLVEPTSDRGAVRAALDRVRPSAAPTSYRAAIARALDVIGTRSGRIVLVSDLQTGGWAEGPQASLPARVTLAVQDVGPMPPNAGIVALDAINEGFVARIRSTGPARTLPVELAIDGRVVSRQQAKLPDDATTEVLFKVGRPARGAVVARFATADGVPADDERWLVLDARPRPPALVVTSPGAGQADGLYVRRALEAAEAPRAWNVVVLTSERVRDEAALAGAAVVVLVGTAGMDRRGVDTIAAFVARGGGLLVPVGPSVNVELLTTGFDNRFPRVRLGPPSDEPLSLAPTDIRHPVFRLFDQEAGAFNAVRFTRAATLATTGDASVIARFDNGAAALIAQRHGRGRLAVLASDLSNRWNDLVLQPAFVPFLNEAAAWLADSSALPVELIAGTSEMSGTERPGVVNWTSPAAPPEAAAMPLAVNVDEREFDASRLDTTAFAAMVERRANDGQQVPALARRQEAEQGWWRYGLGLMLIGLVIESIIGRRG